MIVLSQTSLILTADGVHNSYAITITESGYSGTFTPVIANPTIATATITGSTLTITATAVGSTNIAVVDTNDNVANISVVVYGPLTAIALPVTSSSLAQFLVAKAGYTGSFTITPVSGGAFVTPLTSIGPGPVIISVTPSSPGGSESLTITDSLGESVNITVTTENVTLGELTYTLLDSNGTNPLPPSVVISVYPAGAQQNAQTLADSGYVLVGGRVKLTLLENTAYTGVFSGYQAPVQPISFTSPTSTSDTTALTIIVAPYTSPVLSAIGYAEAMLDLEPNKWLTDAAKLPGGNAYNVALGIGSQVAAVDYQAQVLLASLRLDTCEGLQLESYAADFLGFFPRFPAESDDSYRARIKVELQSDNLTLEAIAKKVQTYIDATPSAEQGTILTFDYRTNPTLSAQVGITDGSGKFCVVLPTVQNDADAFFANRSFLGRNSYLLPLNTLAITSDVDPNIIAIVERTMAGGATPVYAQIET